MKIINSSNKNRVYSEWLKSEIYRMKSILTPEQIAIIQSPDLNNNKENVQREDLLLNVYGRKPIMDHVPANIAWHIAEIEDVDSEKLHILAIWDWFIDTGKSFKLINVPSNLSSSHGHRVSNFPPGAADHKTKINEMSRTISNIQDMVIIASSHIGPFTIIDGTHRSSLLAIRGQLAGTKVYLGIANDLSQCVWAPEWTNYQQSIDELNRLVDGGYLW